MHNSTSVSAGRVHESNAILMGIVFCQNTVCLDCIPPNWLKPHLYFSVCKKKNKKKSAQN